MQRRVLEGGDGMNRWQEPGPKEVQDLKGGGE